MLDDIFDIVTFIHPSAVQLLLNNSTMLQKYMFIKEKASKRSFWVKSRHHLFYIWHFFGYKALPEEYPSYDSTEMNDFHRVTRWKRNIAKLTQSVLLRGHHNRIYHHSSSSKNYYHSIELPLDWLIYYDSLSRVSRDHTEIYGYKLFSVLYIILPDKTKRESHYHNSTEDLDIDWLISSKRKKITVCHSSHTTYLGTS